MIAETTTHNYQPTAAPPVLLAADLNPTVTLCTSDKLEGPPAPPLSQTRTLLSATVEYRRPNRHQLQPQQLVPTVQSEDVPKPIPPPPNPDVVPPPRNPSRRAPKGHEGPDIGTPPSSLTPQQRDLVLSPRPLVSSNELKGHEPPPRPGTPQPTSPKNRKAAATLATHDLEVPGPDSGPGKAPNPVPPVPHPDPVRPAPRPDNANRIPESPVIPPRPKTPPPPPLRDQQEAKGQHPPPPPITPPPKPPKSSKIGNKVSVVKYMELPVPLVLDMFRRPPDCRMGSVHEWSKVGYRAGMVSVGV